ncbi:YkgB family protein [Amycolatopsis sp. NPDC004368]
MGGLVVRYGLVLVIAWIAVLKLTASEAMRIQQYVSHSPLLGWLNDLLAPRPLAVVLGAVEFAAAVLIAAGPWLPRVSAVGSALGVLVFLTTLSFFVTTPGVGDAAAGGFPALSPVGQFLLKDVVLLGASIWTLGRSLGHRPSSVDE